jgi:carbamoyltransferase
MKIILGINANHADSSACIIINGKLVCAIEEERINRIKHYSGFPQNAIKACLRISKIDENEITDIAFNTKPLSNLKSKIFFYIKNFRFKKNIFSKNFSNKLNVKKFMKSKFKFNSKVKYHFIEHHLSHIASSYYPSNFKKAYGLSIDGSGDFLTMAFAKCNQNKIKIFKKEYFPNSLGIFYHAMTQFLGFKNYGDEYKVMGLASYGYPKYFNKIKENLFKESLNSIFYLNLDYFNHQRKTFKYITGKNLKIDKIYSDKLNILFKNEINDKEFKENFASSTQKIYEFFFKKILKQITHKNYSKNLCFAGGCALNSTANNLLITDSSLFKNIFIPFAPGDNGGAMGAAIIVATKYELKLENLKTPYLGENYTQGEILDILQKAHYSNFLKFELIENDNVLNIKVANLITNSKVIGWFQNKMEFGPRALGNRSILADPRNANMKNIINKKIKLRESFRPFAPSVIKEFQSDWFEDNFNNLYMSSTSRVKEDKKNIIPAVTHVDGTARIQSVNKEMNSKFYNLIMNFYKITNVPILLNTSFNENEPIVNTPEHSLDCFMRTDMDALVLNNFLILKK